MRKRDIGLYERIIASYPLLERQEEIGFAKRAREGDREAQEIMIYSNIRLVMSIARRYAGESDFLDVVNDGVIGLLKAIRKYDPNKGAKFGTYATFWIKQSIRRQKDNNRDFIRVPSNGRQTIRETNRFREEFLEANGCEPGFEEIRKYFISKGRNFSEGLIREFARKREEVLSLDYQTEESSGILRALEDEKAVDPVERVQEKEMLGRLFSGLEDREIEILKYRFGLGRRRLTLKQVGKKFGITRERVRQLEKESLDAIRRSNRDI